MNRLLHLKIEKSNIHIITHFKPFTAKPIFGRKKSFLGNFIATLAFMLEMNLGSFFFFFFFF